MTILAIIGVVAIIVVITLMINRAVNHLNDRQDARAARKYSTKIKPRVQRWDVERKVRKKKELYDTVEYHWGSKIEKAEKKKRRLLGLISSGYSSPSRIKKHKKAAAEVGALKEHRDMELGLMSKLITGFKVDPSTGQPTHKISRATTRPPRIPSGNSNKPASRKLASLLFDERKK